jgi:hypothetical protein
MIGENIEDLINIRLAKTLNINAMKIAMIVTGSSDDKMFLKNVTTQLNMGMPYIFCVNDEKGSNYKVPFGISFPQTTSFLAPLRDEYNSTHNDILAILGVNFSPVDKKERLVSAEADSNNQEVSNILSKALEMREDALKKINEMFNLNLSVELQEQEEKDEEEAKQDANNIKEDKEVEDIGNTNKLK